MVFIQQKKQNEKEENWTTLEQFMIPKIFVNFIATLPDKKESEDCGGIFITSSCFVLFLSLTHPLYPYDLVTLAKENQTILCKYDCNCVTFFENQLGVVRACNDLTNLWGLSHSPESPPPKPGCVSTQTSDPSETSEHRLARRNQQQFWKTYMKQQQKMKTEEQRPVQAG